MRQIQFPEEFEKLTNEQLQQVNSWLDEHPYRVVHEKLEIEFGIEISANKLCRYCERREVFDQILGDPEEQLSVREFYKVMNGQPVPYDEASLALVAKKTYEHALMTRELSPNQLLTLQRLANYKTHLDLTLRRLALTEQKQALSRMRGSLRVSAEEPSVVPTASTDNGSENEAPQSAVA